MTDGQSPAPELLAELATLSALARAAGRARSSREVGSAALELLRRPTDADAGVVLFDDGAGLVSESDFGFPPGAVEAILADRSMSDRLIAALEHSPDPISSPIHDVPMRPDIRDALAANGLRWVLVAPLRASGNVVGLIGLGWRDQPRPDALEAIRHAALVVGPSLENAHLVERLERNIDRERHLANEESALQTLTLLAGSAGGFDELAATTVRQVVALLGAAAGSYVLLTNDDRVVHAAAVNLDEEFIQIATRVPASELVSVQRLLALRAPYLIDYAESMMQPVTLERASRRGWTKFGMLPITVGERIEALIVLFFAAPPDLPDPERTLAGIARIASISLANFRLRERLQASEARYRLLFEQTPDAIVLLGPDLEVVDANPAALELYRTDVEGLRTHAREASGLDATDRVARFEEVQRDGHARFRGVGTRADGSTFPEEVDVGRMRTEDESRWLVLVRDLTEQHRLQQELLQAQKMEAIGQLVSGVAHELNNPLAAIVAFSQLLRADERLPDDMRRDAELLVQEADRTRRIVANLLDFARQRPPERHPTPIRPLVESVLALQAYSLVAGRITVDVDVPDDLPLIEVDRSQLQQVLLNLTLNALQAIRSVRDEGHIWITARRVGAAGSAGSRVRITVADNGAGIPDELRSRLFLPFFTTKQPGQGTGLGLSVSFGIVAAHGGTLRFEPRRESGASFIVEVPVGGAVETPVRPGRARPARTASTAPGPDAGRGRILILDDEPSIRIFLTKALRLAGFDPVIADAGEEAIERCRSETFDAILIDHRMPGLSGTEVYAAMTEIRPDLAGRFVFMSGDVLNPELRDFAAANGVGLLAKPFDVETVRTVVSEVVGDGTEAAEPAVAQERGSRG